MSNEITIVYVDGYRYTKTPHKYADYGGAEGKVDELKGQGCRALVVYQSERFTVYAVV